MLEKIEKLLEKAQPENVKLYFVERDCRDIRR